MARNAQPPRIRDGEDGHGATLGAPIIGAVGAVLLGIGAASDDMGWLAVAGGIVLAVGLIALMVINHGTVEKDMYGRLDEIEKK
jgi:hypothetical protein